MQNIFFMQIDNTHNEDVFLNEHLHDSNVRIACIDIGSTWTKGACFRVENGSVELVSRSMSPTTVTNLQDGFDIVLNKLVEDDPYQMLRDGELFLEYSSSAKGGLAVAAIGLVPEATLEIGKIAAQSAGAKLTKVFSFNLSESDISELEKEQPDILLLSGGTNGGNTNYVLGNAKAIGQSAINCEIIYAGNGLVAKEVSRLMQEKRLTIVENLMPSFYEPNPGPAHDAIREIFLKTIIKGKGLDRIMDSTGVAPVPTPYAMFEFSRAIRKHVPSWESFILLDMGGATTDVYSVHEEEVNPGVIRQGLPEPETKRTVEGDLGMRVSAHSTVAVGITSAELAIGVPGLNSDEFMEYVENLTHKPEHLPLSSKEEAFDVLLAGICVGNACARHVGRIYSVLTEEGELKVQSGRDLRTVQRVIGSGGWLARAAEFFPQHWLLAHVMDANGAHILMPQEFQYFRDEEYLFPLLANLARKLPAEAAMAAVRILKLSENYQT